MRPLAVRSAPSPHPGPDSVVGPPPGAARRLAALARGHRHTLALFALVTALGGITAALTPFALRTLVDDGIVAGRSDVVLRMALAACELAVADALLYLVRQWLAARVGEDLALDLRSRAYVHVQHQTPADLGGAVPGSGPASPERWRTLDEDVDRVRAAVTGLLAGAAGSAVILACLLGAVAAMSWPLALLVVLVLAVARRPARAAALRARTRREERANAVAEVEALTAERFAPAGSALALLYGDPEREADAFDVHAAQLRDLGVRVAMGDGAVAMMRPLLTAIGTAVAYGAGGLLVVGGHLSLGGLVATAAALGRLHRAAGALDRAPAGLATLRRSGTRLFAALDSAPPLGERLGAVGLWRGPTAVAFEHVDVAARPVPAVEVDEPDRFAEPEDPAPALGPMILRDITFRIEPGELVAVVGPAGAGTAALSALVPRLLDVTAGAVRLGGVDVRDATIDSLRAKVGVVPAEAPVLAESLAVNLRIARPEATDAELLDTLARVELDDLVAGLPRGLDTRLGERGHQLPFSERQRLALGRILLQEPDVVVVNEAAAPLDPASDRAGQRALAAAVAGRTAIVVAHRLATVRRADRIVVVSGGRVIEQGTHLELLANDRLYTQLFHLELAEAAEEGRAHQAVLS